MKYAVAVILYNPDDSVEEQLDVYASIFKTIYIMDNSEKKNYYLVQKINESESFKYFSMKGNKGVSVALNYAFNLSLEDGIDFLLTMDQDSKYSKDNIIKMINYIENNNNDSVAIYVANFAKIYWDKKYEKQIIGRYLISDNEVKEVKMCLTSSSFIRISSIKDILPLEDYFIGYVDNYISTKLIENGYTLIRVGCSKFEQQVGYPVVYSRWNELFRVLNHNPIRYYYMYRNSYYYQNAFSYDKKYIKSSKKMRMRFLFNIIIAEKNKIKKLRACYLGYVDYKNGILGQIPMDYLKRIK